MKSSKPILLIEDDNIDAMTVRRALTSMSPTASFISSMARMLSNTSGPAIIKGPVLSCLI